MVFIQETTSSSHFWRHHNIFFFGILDQMTSWSLSSQTARGAEYQPGMLFTVFVIILLAALDGFAPAVANDLACADVYIYITRGGCRERKGKINTRPHKPRTSRYRYPFAVSPLLSHAFSSSDILYQLVLGICHTFNSHNRLADSRCGLAHMIGPV